jgi:lipopolysaccharide export system protein LptA
LELSRADAYGHVIVTTTQDVVTGDRGDYNADTGIVTLTGNVQMTRGTNVLHGGYAHVDLNTGISTLFGNPAGDPQGKARAEGTFVPTPKDGGDQRTPLFTGKGVNKTKPSDGSEPQAMQQGTQQ